MQLLCVYWGIAKIKFNVCVESSIDSYLHITVFVKFHISLPIYEKNIFDVQMVQITCLKIFISQYIPNNISIAHSQYYSSI